MRQMRADGMTYQQIADTVGVSTQTAHNVARDVELSNFGKVTGADGKQYPASYERKPGTQPDSEYRTVLTENDIAPTTAQRWQTVAIVRYVFVAC